MNEDEHLSDRYLRYHSDIYMPVNILEAAVEFLPDEDMDLPLSRHYEGIRDERSLPSMLTMPRSFDIVDVTVIRDTRAVFRVCIRYIWSRSTLFDLILILEGDHEVVSAYWNAKDDRHKMLDPETYVQSPAKAEFWEEGAQYDREQFAREEKLDG